jgi:WD40 repeat protein
VLSVAFAPDGQTLATGGADGAVRLWDLADRARPRPLGPLQGHTDAVSSVAFAPDGTMLATGGADNTVRLWDLADRARPRPLGPPLQGRTGSVLSVAFAPDGQMLATGGDDRTVRLWDLAALVELRDHLVERACAQTGTGLDEQNWRIYAPNAPYRQTCTV